MERQLIKVAKEFNVGKDTIVEFLHEKGIEIDNKPIAKITDDMYTILYKKFSGDMTDKQQADQMVIGTRPAAPVAPAPVVRPAAPLPERKSVSLFPPKEPAPEVKAEVVLPQVEKVEPQPPVVEVVVPEVKPIVPEPVAAVQPRVDAVQETPVVESNVIQRPVLGTTVVGKIDLSPRRTEKPAQPAARTEQPKTTPRPEQNRPINSENKLGHKPANTPIETPSLKKSEQPAVKAPSVPTPPPVIEAVSEEKDLSPEEMEIVRADTPQLRGLKIQGKIDVDRFSREDKERLKSAKDKKKLRAIEAAKVPDKPAAPIDGSKLQNTMNSGGSDANKKKRKRKKVPTDTNTGGNTTNQQSGGQQQGGNTTGGNTSGGPQRTGGGGYQGGGQRTGGGYQGGGQRTGGGYQGNNSNNSSFPPRRLEPTEISKQEIDSKIKETMARLNMGGKNKGQKIRRDKREKNRERAEIREAASENGKLQVTEFISVSDLASLMEISPTQIITTCMSMGIFVAINQRLDAELIEVIASEFDKEVEFISAEEQIGLILEEEPDEEGTLEPRAPIVTVMGHVDHGKTSLLDYIRKTDVAAGEAGGITQHIGAYAVKLADGKKITFLDTPGHEAFTAMRARGAKVTDVAIVIVAADDNIMPQTREAIAHAQAAGVPIVFAINKIDKEGADPTRIKQELAQMNILVEEWGGKFQSQDISAKKGIGIEALLEKIVFEADILDLKANPNKRAIGTIVEASLDKGRGYVTKVLVQAGTLRVGDPIVAGEYAGKIRAMFNERGKKVETAGPSAPVLVLGLAGAPQAGEKFKVMETESAAKEIATKRAQIVREQSARANKRISLLEIGRRLALGSFKELNLIIKGDVDGSVEALADALLKQGHETVQVNILLKAVGAIKESDVTLASASDAIIIGFQVRPTPSAKLLAEREGVEIKNYSIIYEAIEEIRSAIEGMLEPTKEERILGNIEVREVYKISKIGTIAGCYVQDGKVLRNSFIRVIRDGIVVHPSRENQKNGTLGSLKRFKEDVKEVKNGFEFGCTVDGFNDIEVGDFIEAYEIIEVKQKL
jgi:translation initiation factor IF-2